MVAENDITGNKIQSRVTTDAYREGWERIFQGQKNDYVWIIDEDENHINIIVDYHENPNNFLRLNQKQFEQLCNQIIQRVSNDH